MSTQQERRKRKLVDVASKIERMMAAGYHCEIRAEGCTYDCGPLGVERWVIVGFNTHPACDNCFDAVTRKEER